MQQGVKDTTRTAVTITELLIWLFVLLTPLQDTILQKSPLKLVVASPAAVPLAILLFFSCAREILRPAMRVRRLVLAAFVYMFIVCMAHLVSVQPAGITLELKPLRDFGIETGLFLFAVFGIDYRMSRGLRIAIYFGLAITVIGILINVLIGPNAIPLLQTTPNLSGRMSGFSTEASTLSVEVATIGMLTAHMLRKTWKKWCIAIFTCALLVLSGSKGGLVCLLVCGVALPLIKVRSSIWAKLIVACTVLPLVGMGGGLLLSRFTTIVSANQTSTIATRISMAVYALITVAHDPLGVGFTGFFPSISRYLPRAMYDVQSVFPFGLWFGEVRGYLYPPHTDADCKTFFFDFLVFFGVPFAIGFLVFAYSLLKKLITCGYYWLFVGVLFSVFSLMTYYSSLNAYAVPLLFGVALSEAKRHKDPIRVY